MAKILVADDNSNIQKMVGLALKDQGIDVVAVGNGEAAVRKISDIRPDLVLADVFMPVRNGYEVCKYVKDDKALCHIPVILLVGAFDPLDEQEAQRVGADGVLKKPFVPPDPLISMVKSALQRAGVSLEKQPAAAEKTAEKAPLGGARVAKEVLGPVASAKLAAVTAVPEAEAEPVLGSFSKPGPASVKFAAGNEPLAFGSLLETPEVEDDIAFTAKPSEALEAARHWGTASESDEVEEEEEGEESGHAAWRPAGLEESLEQIATSEANAKGQDWREEAFHGSSPANGAAGHKWTPVEATPVEEVANAPRVGVSTLEHKPLGAPAPFAGDAWAAALATTVQEKIVEANGQTAEAVAPMDANATVIEPLPQTTEAAGPANWASVTDTPWELEAKKASLLAATWDAPAPSTLPSIAEAAQFLQESPAAEAPSAIVNEFVEETSFHGTSEVSQEQRAEVTEAPAAGSVESGETKSTESSYELPALDFSAPETSTESAYASSAPAEMNETQETPTEQESSLVSQAETHSAEVEIHHAEPAAAVEAPDMDALVARVVAKMSPDVLQRVTQEILKPVIEALIKDELASKK
ncbi:MAG TPA: response regulator [Candidatus Limnocylindrales bacterium]|nr:response regulator [Candidatus Limnocylindrales bacterium]